MEHHQWFGNPQMGYGGQQMGHQQGYGNPPVRYGGQQMGFGGQQIGYGGQQMGLGNQQQGYGNQSQAYGGFRGQPMGQLMSQPIGQPMGQPMSQPTTYGGVGYGSQPMRNANYGSQPMTLPSFDGHGLGSQPEGLLSQDFVGGGGAVLPTQSSAMHMPGSGTGGGPQSMGQCFGQR